VLLPLWFLMKRNLHVEILEKWHIIKTLFLFLYYTDISSIHHIPNHTKLFDIYSPRIYLIIVYLHEKHNILCTLKQYQIALIICGIF